MEEQLCPTSVKDEECCQKGRVHLRFDLQFNRRFGACAGVNNVLGAGYTNDFVCYFMSDLL
jgi:hypothetical protein